MVLVLALVVWLRRDEPNEVHEVPTASVTDRKDAVAAKSMKRSHRAPAQASSTKKREATVQQRETPLQEHVRAQTLVAQGYRSLQQRDLEGAEDDFQQALEIEPNNVAAQKGLRAAKTAQTVQGVAGVLGR